MYDSNRTLRYYYDNYEGTGPLHVRSNSANFTIENFTAANSCSQHAYGTVLYNMLLRIRDSLSEAGEK